MGYARLVFFNTFVMTNFVKNAHEIEKNIFTRHHLQKPKKQTVDFKQLLRNMQRILKSSCIFFRFVYCAQCSSLLLRKYQLF